LEVQVTDTALERFRLDPARMQELAREHEERYRRARPFPHAVIDDFVPTAVIDACAAEFPDAADPRWDLYTDEGNTLKLATSDLELMGPVSRQLIAEFNGKAMIEFLEALTGIGGLVADPHLLGGGLHQLNVGGFLRVHADFNVHPRLNLDRRLNVLLFLNRDWREEYGGQLELWNHDMSACERSVLPIAGRCVIFNTTDSAFHGNPRPVSCPPGMARRSLAFYYYTRGRPEEERSPAHTTLYQTPGAYPSGAEGRRRRSRARAAILRIAPPILVDAARRVRARTRSSRRDSRLREANGGQ
jgi:2OG-Fe(II) oxygenase superfamily